MVNQSCLDEVADRLSQVSRSERQPQLTPVLSESQKPGRPSEALSEAEIVAEELMKRER